MSKKKGIVLILLVCVLSSIGIANATLGLSESEQLMKDAGESLKDTASLVISGEDGGNSIQSQAVIVAEVNGRSITATEMNLKIQMYALTGKNANEAWDGMKLVALEEDFAREHGFMPTESEIMERAQQLRAEVEAVQESSDHVAALASGLGMTLDEYWYEYRVTYEIPTLMVRERVLEYNEANALPDLDIADADCTIYDAAYFQSKGISVGEVM